MHNWIHRSVSATAVLACVVSSSHAQSNDFYDRFVVTHDSLQSNANFGRAVEVDSGIVAVGMMRITNPDEIPGRVFFFHAETGEFIREITAENDFNDVFGMSLSADNGVIAVGARLAKNHLGTETGGVYLYDMKTGLPISKFFPEDGEQYDFFGNDIALDGDTLVVGAWGVDDGMEYQRGAAYVIDTRTGEQLAKLTASDGKGFDQFGYYITIGEGLIAVSAIGADVQGPGSGSVYLYNAKTFQEIGVLSNGQAPGFGSSVVIHRGILAIGAHGYRDDIDSRVYLFDTHTLEEIGSLIPDEQRLDEYFGWRMDAHEGRLAVVAPGNSFDGVGVGSSYIFDLETQTQIARFLHAAPEFGDSFGSDIAISDHHVVIGSDEHNIDSRHGSAYLYSIRCRGDFNRDLRITLEDINSFLELYALQDPAADLDENGELDYFDLSVLMNAYKQGCGH